MENQMTWVVAANGSHAKIFRVVKFPKIEELTVLEHPESHLRNQDLVSAKEGRSFESMGTGRSAYEAAVDPHHMEIEKFAKVLASYLTEELRKKSFSRLYLMASPTFLGLLRPHFNAPLQTAIIAEISKDMTEHSHVDIEHHLEKA